jgi:tight adherence protein C
VRLMTIAALLAGAGTTVLLSSLRWASRLELVDRLRPYVPGGVRAGTPRAGAGHSVREVLAPLASGLGNRAGRLLGVNDDLALRLTRAHSNDDPSGFRMRQIGSFTSGLVVAVLVGLAVGLPSPVTLILIVGLPTLGFLLPEHRLSTACDDHQRRLFLELPIVAEQIGMLLASGYSLTLALDRVAERTRGACSADLQRVMARLRQGIAPDQALREWAEIAGVDELNQLVSILVLHEDAGDLGRLISNESRSMRRAAQRRLLEHIERRSQQVWIPVTVAALVPGVIYLAIPFVSALSSLGGL